MRSTWCHDQVIKWAKAKVYVYSDAVFCLGKIHDHSDANETWKSQPKDFQQTNEYKELFGNSWRTKLSSSCLFPKDSNHCRFSKRSNKIWKHDKYIQNNMEE